MSYQDILRGLLPPVSYARNAPRVRAQAEIDGAALDAVAESAQSVADAVDPRSAGQMLADWERVLGLDGTGKNRQRRVLAVMAKLNETGGLSIPYFVRLAEAAGYQIQIDEPQPFRAGVTAPATVLRRRKSCGCGTLTCAAATTALPDSAPVSRRRATG